MDQSPLDELKKLVIDQKKVSLPFEAPDPALDELHNLLVEYDGQVSLLVISALQGQPVDVPEQRLDEIHAALDALFASPEIQSVRQIALYRSYRDRLERMRQLARQQLKGA